MGSRWFNSVVVLFWLSSMGWLVWQKVLPQLLLGDPPDYQSMLPAPGEDPPPPVAWNVFFHDAEIDKQPIGTATSEVTRGEQGILVATSRVSLRNLPLARLVPNFIKLMLGPEGLPNKGLELDIHSEMQFDGLGRLLSFETQVQSAHVKNAVTITGEVDGSQLTMRVKVPGSVQHEITTPLGANALVGDELAPRSRLKGLRLGQQWTVPVYSPFRPDAPMEILLAKVEREQFITWQGRRAMTRLVVYRSNPGMGLGKGGEERGRMWVADGGNVLVQEMKFLRGWLTFERQAKREGEE